MQNDAHVPMQPLQKDAHVPMQPLQNDAHVPNFEQPKCVVNTSPQCLVHDKMQYLETIAKAAFEILKKKFQYVFDQFNSGDSRIK